MRESNSFFCVRQREGGKAEGRKGLKRLKRLKRAKKHAPSNNYKKIDDYKSSIQVP